MYEIRDVFPLKTLLAYFTRRGWKEIGTTFFLLCTFLVAITASLILGDFPAEKVSRHTFDKTDGLLAQTSLILGYCRCYGAKYLHRSLKCRSSWYETLIACSFSGKHISPKLEHEEPSKRKIYACLKISLTWFLVLPVTKSADSHVIACTCASITWLLLFYK